MLLDVLLSTSPYDPWHDTALQTIVLAIATIIAAAVPRLIEHHDRREITYETTLDTSVPSTNNTHLLNIRLSNTGNTSIHPNDYVRPIEIDLAGRNVLPTSPPTVSDQTGQILDEDELKNFFKVHPAIAQEDRVKLNPFLFQRGEALTISIIVVGAKGQADIGLSARLNPETKIVRAGRGYIKQLRLILPLLLGLITLIWTSRLVSSALLFWDVQTTVTIILFLYTLFLIVVFVIAYKLKIIRF